MIEAKRRINRPFRRVVGNQHGERYSRMPLLCRDHRFCCHTVKPAVMTDDEFCDTVFCDVLLNCFC